MDTTYFLVVYTFSIILTLSHGLIEQKPFNVKFGSALLVEEIKHILDSVKPCTLLLGHDFEQTIPDELTKINHYWKTQDQDEIQIGLYATSFIPDIKRPAPIGWEHSFSWLQRDSAVPGGSCTVALILFKSQNIENILEKIARKIILRSTRDYFIFINRDEPEASLMWLQRPHAKKLKFKIGIIAKGNNDLELYTDCFFCENGKSKITVLKSVTNSTPVIELNQYFPDFTGNLHGKYLEGTFLHDISKKQIKHAQENCIPAFYVEPLYMLMGDAMNFDFEAGMLTSGMYDMMLENGTWVGPVSKLIYEVNDIVFTGVRSTALLRAVDQTLPYSIEYLTFQTRKPRPSFSWEAVIQPYSYEMWILILLSAMVASVFFWKLQKALGKFQNPFYPKKPPRHPLGYSIQYIFFTITEENPELLPTGHTLRIFIIFWWLYSMVIICAYDCKLIAFLSSPQLETLPSTFEEMVDTPGWGWGMNKSEAGYFPFIVQFSTNKAAKYMEQTLQTSPTIFKCLERSINENYGCINIVNRGIAASYYFLYQDGYTPLMTQKETNYLLYISAFLPKHSILTPKFDQTIERLYEHGFVPKFIADEAYCAFNLGLRKARASNRVRIVSGAFKVEQLKGPFMIMVVFGWILPTFILLLEKRKKRARRRNLTRQ